MDPLLRDTLLGLFDVGAVKFGRFRLKLHETRPDAPLSPIYIDLRLIRSHPQILRNVVLLLGREAIGYAPDFIADVPTAATPIVGALAVLFDLPMITPRVGTKTHGIKSAIEGAAKPGASVLLIDDLITTAASKLEVAGVLRDNGLRLDRVLVLIDREQGGARELESNGLSLRALATLSELLSLLVENNRISTDTAEAVRAYISQT